MVGNHRRPTGQALRALRCNSSSTTEEGGESNVLHGDAGSEQFLSEIIGAQAYPERHLSMESIYEYGSRAGVWRLLREFETRKLPLTIFAVAMALQRKQQLPQSISTGWFRPWMNYSQTCNRRVC